MIELTEAPIFPIIIVCLGAAGLGGVITLLALDLMGLAPWNRQNDIEIELERRHADGTVERGTHL